MKFFKNEVIKLFIIRFFKRIFYLIRYLSWIDPKTKIGKNCKVGPFSYIREKVVLKDNVVIGHCVEIKNSTIGENTKIKHHAYIGDAEIGKNVNIGAGTVICDYDGKEKHKTTIKDKAFIGSNVTLVAPIIIGENAYVGAGSTVTEEVLPNTLAIARGRQVNKQRRLR